VVNLKIKSKHIINHKEVMHRFDLDVIDRDRTRNWKISKELQFSSSWHHCAQEKCSPHHLSDFS